MSTSSSAAARQALETAAPFPYAEVEGESEILAGPTGAEGTIQRMQAETLERGRQEGREQMRVEFNAALQKERQQIATTLQQFSSERQSYYHRIEAEVVQLALAISRKILHRETQPDPQALTGIVRITLEKLDAGTQVNLHVHPREATDWRHYFASQMEGSPIPEVHEDPALAAGECRLETSLGTTQIGLESQLKEIEGGLLDLLAERPRGPTSSASAAAGVGKSPERRG